MTLSPDFATFEKNYNVDAAQVVMRRVVSDLDTPVSAYLKIAGGAPNSFLLESVEGGEQLGRYSIIGMAPDAVWRADGARAERNDRFADDKTAFVPEEAAPIESLRKFLDDSRIDIPEQAPPMAAGVFGYFGYDMARQIERLPDRPPRALDVPDAIFVRPTVVAVFDNVKQEILLSTPVRPKAELDVKTAYERAEAWLASASAELSTPVSDDLHTSNTAGAASTPASNTTRSDYKKMVERAREHIAAGDIFQVVLSQRFEAPFAAPPFELYRALRRTNPSPFLFFLNFDSHALVGSSPEILVRVRGGEITIRPIAGTRRRGASREEDAALERELIEDPKERAEHLMLLDLGRNDVGRAAKIGSVRVTESFAVERYSHVMHIVSNVVGDLREDVPPVDAVAAGFPAGTVSGAPKIRAMEIIDALERESRGPYGGAIGYFSADGNVDTCIALRTAIVKDGIMHVQAGAGIVADSDPAAEHEECVNKAKALFAAAEQAMRMSSRSTF